MVKARLSGRSALYATDIDETFHTLNVDKVYGAPAHPEFIPFGDEGLYYLNDKKINLIQIAEEKIDLTQGGDVKIEKSWTVLTVDEEEKTEEESCEDSFVAVCEGVVGRERGRQVAALDFLESRTCIARMIDWFYNFAYILLNEYAYSDFLTLCALSMVNRLEGNPVSDFSVSERQLNVITRLLLHKVFLLPENNHLLRLICTIVAQLCRRNALKSSIFGIIKRKSAQLKKAHTLAFLILIRSMGAECVKMFFLPSIDHFFTKSRENNEIKFELLGVYNVIFKERLENDVLYEKYLEVFEETMQMFSFPQRIEKKVKKEVKSTSELDSFFLSMLEKKSSVTMAVNLLKTRRKFPVSQGNTKKIDVNSVFESVEVEGKIKFVGNSLEKENVRVKAEKIYKKRKSDFGGKNDFVVLGRTTLLASVFKNVQYECKKSKCFNHSLTLNL